MRLVLIDGHAILHRAFHAYPPLTTREGELVGAVYGFTSILLTVLSKLHPEFAAVAFDRKGPTFRHKKFIAYKAHRPAMDEGLSGQIPRVHEVVQILNIPIFELDGYEADDVIGTLSTQAVAKNKEGLEVLIVTGDADALQLVNQAVKVFQPGRGGKPDEIVDEDKIKEKYGLCAKQIIDLKALAGDASDGIPGVTGIGPKTATKLISRFGTTEEIYKHLDIIDGVVSQKLKNGKKEAFLSKELATIDIKAPIKLDLPCCTLADYNKGKAIELFEKLSFASLVKKLPQEGGVKVQMGLF